MHVAVAPLLARHPIFSSRDAEETRAFLHAKEFNLEVGYRRARDLDVRINGIYLPGMYVGYIQYGPPVDVRAVQRDDYWIQMPICGQLEVVSAPGSVICDPRRAAVASPTSRNYYLVRSGSGCAGVRLSLFKAALVGHLGALIGKPVDKPLQFAPEMNLAVGHGRTLARYVLMAIADLQSSGSMLASPIVTSSFEQFIMTGLILSQPHNYTAALRRLDVPILPRDVRRAIDFIEAHLTSPITIADIVAATGVPGRTLFKHFRDYKGVSPIRYLRNARFQSVRDALSKAQPEQSSVTGIAASWGFVHPGRFSVEYRRRFGESPSETLKRRRRAFFGGKVRHEHC
jgi:AraC-like DNA-binding protein